MRERGNVSILMVGGVALAAVLCLGVARVGAAAMLAARADTAADAAALAGADALALGRSSAAANRGGERGRVRQRRAARLVHVPRR